MRRGLSLRTVRLLWFIAWQNVLFVFFMWCNIWIRPLLIAIVNIKQIVLHCLQNLIKKTPMCRCDAVLVSVTTGWLLGNLTGLEDNFWYYLSTLIVCQFPLQSSRYRMRVSYSVMPVIFLAFSDCREDAQIRCTSVINFQALGLIQKSTYRRV